ncbi:MAG: hypothetical protein AAF998_24555 [Bacteroidota bacterium]
MDSLTISSNGTYKRALYRKSDGALMFMHQGDWEKYGDRIILRQFYLDQGEYYSQPPKMFSQSLMVAVLPYEVIDNKTRIYVNRDLGLYFERKE